VYRFRIPFTAAGGILKTVFAFLKSWPARAVTILLVAQAGIMYSSNRPEALPPSRPLADLPSVLGPWTLQQEGVLDAETEEVLKADDVLIRDYADTAGGRVADLYVAAFRSQRNGKAPHSPKNCLPGAGWTPLDQTVEMIDPGTGSPIPVNRYVIAHGDSRSLVLYWYQSRDRAVASEYKAKFWVIADAIRLNRTDTALIRVIVPIGDRDSARAEKTAIDFLRAFYPPLRQILPS
jgi:EpsI family protein